MKTTKAQQRFFTNTLMHWHRNENIRVLPWKKETDPYRIWLSEIILQQTRAEQGLPYYLRFVEQYPSIKDLANTTDEEAFRLWQGLGYYNRCKNMLATARHIVNDLGGKFPDTYEEIIALKGIGAYTAAAISSFAFKLPYAVVDGNVNRALARFFGIETPFDTTEGKKQFQGLATELLDRQHPDEYNQAIMDHGALVCKPAAPLCSTCALQPHCFAFNKGVVGDLPVKSKKLVVKQRHFNYILLTSNGHIWIRKREDKDIWQNLYEPLLIETNQPMTVKGLMKTEGFKELQLPAQPVFEGSLQQRLTHQVIESTFFSIEIPDQVNVREGGVWVAVSSLKNYAFPKTLVSFLEKKLYF